MVEANTNFAKTVCTAGVRLWRAKNPTLLVLGNFTLGPPKAKTPDPRRLLVYASWYPSYCPLEGVAPEGRIQAR